MRFPEGSWPLLTEIMKNLVWTGLAKCGGRAWKDKCKDVWERGACH